MYVGRLERDGMCTESGGGYSTRVTRKRQDISVTQVAGGKNDTIAPAAPAAPATSATPAATPAATLAATPATPATPAAAAAADSTTTSSSNLVTVV